MLLLEDVVADVEGRRVLDRASLVVPRGGCTIVVTDDGHAGRLLLDLLGGVRRPTAGRVRVDGLDPARAPGLEGRIGSASVQEQAGPLLGLTLDRRVDVWLLDATTGPATVLEAWLELLDRSGAPSNPTVLVVAGVVPTPAGDRLLHLRDGRLIELSSAP